MRSKLQRLRKVIARKQTKLQPKLLLTLNAIKGFSLEHG